LKRTVPTPQHRPIHQLRDMRGSLVTVAAGMCEQRGDPCDGCIRNAADLVCDFLETLPGGSYTAAEMVRAVRVASSD
jgi:hypothetical protein